MQKLVVAMALTIVLALVFFGGGDEGKAVTKLAGGSDGKAIKFLQITDGVSTRASLGIIGPKPVKFGTLAGGVYFEECNMRKAYFSIIGPKPVKLGASSGPVYFGSANGGLTGGKISFEDSDYVPIKKLSTASFAGKSSMWSGDEDCGL